MSQIVIDPIDAVGVQNERGRLANQPGCRFVEPDEFAALAVSWRKMERRNIASCDLLGLFDLNSKEWFLIEEEKFCDGWKTTKA